MYVCMYLCTVYRSQYLWCVKFCLSQPVCAARLCRHSWWASPPTRSRLLLLLLSRPPLDPLWLRMTGTMKLTTSDRARLPTQLVCMIMRWRTTSPHCYLTRPKPATKLFSMDSTIHRSLQQPTLTRIIIIIALILLLLQLLPVLLSIPPIRAVDTVWGKT